LTGAQVVLDQTLFWALVAVVALAALTGIIAAVAAVRATKSTKSALARFEASRREVAAPQREWQERSPNPRRAADAPRQLSGPDTEPVPPAAGWVPGPAPLRAAPAPSPPAPRPRRTDELDDPDRPGTPAGLRQPVTRGMPPEGLRTEPLPPRPVAAATTLIPTPPAPAPPGPAAPQRPAPRPAAPQPSAPEPTAPELAPAPPQPTALEYAPAAPQPTALEPALPPPQPTALEAALPPAPAGVAWVVHAAITSQPAPAESSDHAAARLQRLRDPDPFVRIEAMEQFRGHPALQEALLRALRDDYPVVRRQAVRALKEVGGPRATKALLEVANQDPSAEVREEAVGALAAMLRETRPNRAEA
jgi:hypothetical protein